jgi:3-deoxy-manno-octulosonate cytidylyltransferase (CMP-KDO synthetase)
VTEYDYPVVIPARWASTRFPGKVLHPISGRPMLAHVVDRARESGATRVIVASESTTVLEAARSFGVEGCLTSPAHASGTDRIGEVADRMGWDDETLVVNLQGDEPLMPGSLVEQCALLLARTSTASMATLGVALHARDDFSNPNIVKIVTDIRGHALYFSRAPIPFPRGDPGQAEGSSRVRGALRHVGLYAYRVGALRRLVREPPCELEQIERLEQLRALWIGIGIAVESARTIPGPSIDEPGDIARAEAWLDAGHLLSAGT